jgi:hypothetical protein
MGETATAEAEREAAGVVIGEFRRRGWAYRMYLHGDDTVKVHRVYPDPENGRDIAEAVNLGQYEEGKATFTFRSDWSVADMQHGEVSIVNAYKRTKAEA